MSRRVLVTGASGFVGRRTLALLRAQGDEVHAVARHPQGASGVGGVCWHAADLLDPPQRLALIEDVRATHLLHLAWYAEPGKYWGAPENATWVAATLDLLGAFAAAGGTRAVLAGTCAEYDWSAAGILREDAATAPATFYGVCKDATRRIAEGLGERAGIEVAWGRLFFIYGPGEDERRLVASVARSLIAGERVATTAGTQVRDFLHVDDVAGALAGLTGSGVGGIVNVGSGEGVTVRRVIELTARAAGRPDLLDVGVLAPRPGEPPELVADVARLRDEVGFVPSLRLEDGLAATVRWWRETVGR